MVKKFGWGTVLGLCLLLLGGAAAAGTPVVKSVDSSSGASGYHLVRVIALPGDGGWDYLTLDSVSRLLYVSHDDQVQVVNVDENNLVGDVAPLQGIHGIALAPDLNHGYISDGKASSVACFNLKSLSITAQVPTGKKPDAIVFDKMTSRTFAFNGESDSVTVIQAGDDTVLETIDLKGSPEFAVADGFGHIFVNLEDQNQLVRIDADQMKITGRWSVAPGSEPSSLSMDGKRHRLFIGCRSKVMVVMDSDTGRVVAHMSIGAGVDASAFDPKSELVFHSCGDGTLSIIREDGPDNYSLVENLPTKKGARTLALDLKTHRVYLADAEFGPAPEPTLEHPHPRPAIIPGSFSLWVYGRD